MHVLREVHKSLRRNGILLDFHPQPQDSPVEVVHTSGTQEVGRIDWTQDGREIRRARRRLSALEAEGLFRLECRMYFDLSAEWRRREEGPVKLLPMSPPFFLQAITQSLYHLIPVALVAVPILIAAWWGLTRFSPLPEEVVIQGLAALASGAWLLVAFRFIDRDDNRLIGPTAGSLRGLSAKAFRTRLGRVKVVLLAPIAVAALAWLRNQGFQTTWPF